MVHCDHAGCPDNGKSVDGSPGDPCSECGHPMVADTEEE